MLIEEKAGVQYNDVVGTVAADAHQGGLLHECAKAYGIDIVKYYPLRITIHIARDVNDKDTGVGIASTVHCIRCSDMGGDDIDTVLKRHRERSMPVPVVSIVTGVLSLDVLDSCMKRFEAVLSRKDCVETDMECVERFELPS